MVRAAIPGRFQPFFTRKPKVYARDREIFDLCPIPMHVIAMLQIRELEQQCDECEKQVHSLQDKIKSTEKYEETKRAEEQDKHREQMEYYIKSNEELKRNLESLLSVPTKK